FLCAGVQAFTSVDSTNWIETAWFWSFGGFPEVASLAFGNGTFVAAAEYSGLASVPLTSSDGVEWTAWPQAGTHLGWESVTFGRDVFVMVGTDGSIQSSTTGSNWTWRAFGEFPDAVLINVAYGGGRFIVV